MANIFSAILSGLKKKKDEEDQAAVAVAPVKVPQVQVEPTPVANLKTNVTNAWNNFWQPSPNGVRVQDFVRELPGAAKQTTQNIGNFVMDTARGAVTRPVAQAILSVTDAAGVRANRGKGEVMNTIEIPKEDALGQVLFGDKPLKSYQQQTKDITNWVDAKTPVPKPLVTPIGVSLGIANAALDLPGGGGAKAAGKEAVEQGIKKVGKETLEKTADDIAETIVKNTDELAPLIQELPRSSRSTVDAAVTALKEKGYKVADDVIAKLKSGKVVDGEGYVLQSNRQGLIANFDKQLNNLLKAPVPPVAVKKTAAEALPSTTRGTAEVLPSAVKGTDDVIEATSKTGSEVVQASRQSDLTTPLKQADEGIPVATKQETPGVIETDVKPAEDYLTSRPVFENLSEEQKNTLHTSLKDSGFESKLAEVKGAPVTRDEVLEEALKIQDTLADPITRKETVDTLAKLQNSQSRVAQLVVKLDEAKKAGDSALSASLEKQVADELLNQRSVASFWGRLGNALQTPGDLNAPTGVKILNKVFGKVDEAKVDEVIAAWNKVDKDNPESLREFYFQFVQPTGKEILDEYKYINLLSSPLTQIRNVSGNFDAVVTDPVTQVVRGVLDRIYTTTGLQKERKTYAREAVEQVTGMVEAIPKALKDAQAVFNRQAIGDNLDISRVPVGKYAEKAEIFNKPGVTLPIRKAVGKATGFFLEKGGKVNDAMQAGDRFFKSIIEAGTIKAKTATAKRLGVELTSEVTADIAKQGKDKGLELTLQSEIKPDSRTQGLLNQAIDVVANGLMKARQAPGVVGAAAGTVFPFVGIAANYLKRVVSYLPGIGALNAVGADNAALREVAARQVTGTLGLAASLWAIGRLAQEDRIAGAAPRDPDGKAAFMSAHPEYSVKIGDTWVQTSRMGVFGKLVETAIRYNEGRYHENDLTDSQAEDMLQALAGTALDMSDESYLASLRLLIDSFSMDTTGNYARSQLASTPVRQNIPLVGFQGWLAKIIDPVNRKSVDSDGGYLSNAFAGVNKNLPFLSLNYDAYLNPDNTESTNSRWNAITPYKVQEGNEQFEQLWSIDRFERQMKNAENRFGKGEINVNELVQSMENASSYFSGATPRAIDMGKQGETKLPTKNELAAATKVSKPMGIDLTRITGSQPAKLTKLSGKIKVGSIPKVGGSKTAKIRLPKLSKTALSGRSGISLASIKQPTPPKAKVGAKLTAELKERERGKRGVRLS